MGPAKRFTIFFVDLKISVFDLLFTCLGNVLSRAQNNITYFGGSEDPPYPFLSVLASGFEKVQRILVVFRWEEGFNEAFRPPYSIGQS
jgi:hypothetical protein